RAARPLLECFAEARCGRAEHLYARGRLEQIGKLAHDVEVERIERACAIEREPGAAAIVELVAQHEAQPQLLARALLRRRAETSQGAQLLDRAIPVVRAHAQAE